MNKSWWNLTKSTQSISDNLLLQNNMYCSLIDTTRTDGLTQRAQTDMDRKQSSNHIVHKSCTTTCCITTDQGICPRQSKCLFLDSIVGILISHINNHKNSYQNITTISTLEFTTISTLEFSTVVYMFLSIILNKLRHHSFLVASSTIHLISKVTAFFMVFFRSV